MSVGGSLRFTVSDSVTLHRAFSYLPLGGLVQHSAGCVIIIIIIIIKLLFQAARPINTHTQKNKEEKHTRTTPYAQLQTTNYTKKVTISN